MNKKYLVIDTETTGLNPEINNILTMAILLCEEGSVKPIKSREFKFKYDNYNVSVGALKINKIDLVEHDKNAYDTFDDVIDFLHLAYMECSYNKPTVIGHNVGFDLGFIHKSIGKEKWEQYVSYRNIDTCTIGRFLSDCGIVKLDNVSLGNLVDYFGLNDYNNLHNALYDATKTWEVYDAMIQLVKGEYNEYE